MATKKSSDMTVEVDFEKTLTELKAIVEKLEQGGLNLEESLKQFEQGIALTRQCQKALAHAEQKVQMLLSENAEEQLETFEGKHES